MTPRRELEEHLLDLLWSLWTELGVRGTSRNHRDVAIPPEELVLLTSYVSHLDPRLRDESLDWCVRYCSYVATARLRSLFKQASEELQVAFSRYAATVNRMVGTRWPTKGDVNPWKVKPGGKSRLSDLNRPALLHLRLRALFGTGARADVVAAFLSRRSSSLSVADVSEIGYTKRNIANVLDSLTTAGLLRVSKKRNQLRYTMAKPEPMEVLVEPLPGRFPRWLPLINLLVGLLSFFKRPDHMAPAVQGVEAVSFLREVDGELASLELDPPDLGHQPQEAWGRLARWAATNVFTLNSDLSTEN